MGAGDVELWHRCHGGRGVPGTPFTIRIRGSRGPGLLEGRPVHQAEVSFKSGEISRRDVLCDGVPLHLPPPPTGEWVDAREHLL